MEINESKRLISVTLDENSIGRGSADQEHERAIAIYDLIEENSFALIGHDGGPYELLISLVTPNWFLIFATRRASASSRIFSR